MRTLINVYNIRFAACCNEDDFVTWVVYDTAISNVEVCDDGCKCPHDALISVGKRSRAFCLSCGQRFKEKFWPNRVYIPVVNEGVSRMKIYSGDLPLYNEWYQKLIDRPDVERKMFSRKHHPYNKDRRARR